MASRGSRRKYPAAVRKMTASAALLSSRSQEVTLLRISAGQVTFTTSLESHPSDSFPITPARLARKPVSIINQPQKVLPLALVPGNKDSAVLPDHNAVSRPVTVSDALAENDKLFSPLIAGQHRRLRWRAPAAGTRPPGSPAPWRRSPSCRPRPEPRWRCR